MRVNRYSHLLATYVHCQPRLPYNSIVIQVTRQTQQYTIISPQDPTIRYYFKPRWHFNNYRAVSRLTP